MSIEQTTTQASHVHCQQSTAEISQGKQFQKPKNALFILKKYIKKRWHTMNKKANLAIFDVLTKLVAPEYFFHKNYISLFIISEEI